VRHFINNSYQAAGKMLVLRVETVYIALVMGLWLGGGDPVPDICFFLPLEFHFIFF